MSKFPIFLPWMIMPLLVTTVQIDLICTLPYDLDVATAVIWTGGAFDLATKAANKRYKSDNVMVNLVWMYNTSHRTCSDIAADSIQTLAEYYYRRSNDSDIHAIVTTQWDWLLLSNGLVQDEMLNRVKNPTSLAIAGTFHGYAVVVAELLTFYQWSHVTIMLESGFVVYRSLSDSLLSLTKSENTDRCAQFPLDLDVCRFDNNSNSRLTALECAKRRSRVLVIYGRGNSVVDLLRAATDAKMDNGEYVFISVQPMQQNSYGPVWLFDHPQAKDLAVFRSFIYIAYDSERSSIQDELDRKITIRTKELYNRSFEATGSPPLSSYAVHASFDIVDLLTAVANESQVSIKLGSSWSGRYLVQQLTNRTFRSQTFGDIHLGKARNLELDIYAFSLPENAMKPLGEFSWINEQFSWTNMSINWPTPDGRPTPDTPLCGFSGLTGKCARSSTTLVAAVSVSAVIMALIILLTYLFRRRCAPPDESIWLSADMLIHPRSEYFSQTEVSRSQTLFLAMNLSFRRARTSIGNTVRNLSRASKF